MIIMLIVVRKDMGPLAFLMPLGSAVVQLSAIYFVGFAQDIRGNHLSSTTCLTHGLIIKTWKIMQHAKLMN